MAHVQPFFAVSVLVALKQFVNVTNLHPIFVDFTAALVPVSVGCDAAGRLRQDETLHHAAWWTLLCAAWITPLTATTGWLFWAPDDNGAVGMAVHKWLGTGLVFVVLALFAWRRQLQRQSQPPTLAYLGAGLLLIATLVLQGHLGGEQAFGGM